MKDSRNKWFSTEEYQDILSPIKNRLSFTGKGEGSENKSTSVSSRSKLYSIIFKKCFQMETIFSKWKRTKLRLLKSGGLD